MTAFIRLRPLAATIALLLAGPLAAQLHVVAVLIQAPAPR